MRKTWRCFHCDDVFLSEKTAQEHFGDDQLSTPACKLGGSLHHLVRIIRKQERELRSYRCEDTELLRALCAMDSDYRQALIREEEKGYARGLRDGMTEAGRADLTKEQANVE